MFPFKKDKRDGDRRKLERREISMDEETAQEANHAETQKIEAKDRFRNSADRLTDILSELKANNKKAV